MKWEKNEEHEKDPLERKKNQENAGTQRPK